MRVLDHAVLSAMLATEELGRPTDAWRDLAEPALLAQLTPVVAPRAIRRLAVAGYVYLDRSLDPPRPLGLTDSGRLAAGSPRRGRRGTG